MGPETGLETRLQHRSKVHPGDGARGWTGVKAILMAELRQGLKAQGWAETGLLGSRHRQGPGMRLPRADKECSGP